MSLLRSQILAFSFCWALLGTLCFGDEMVLVVGAGGQEEYTKLFADWVTQWKEVARSADIELVEEIGSRESDLPDCEKLEQTLKKYQEQSDSVLWLVMLGHGTYDRGVAKFNLRGKDVEAKELNELLANVQRPVVVVNGFSSSGAFLQQLQGKNRVVITATKNGSELNFSRFGGYLAEAMLDLKADLDHDDQISLLESFLYATSKTNEFYKSDARLVTEHALLEDNQDGKGISADFFRGIRAQAKAKDGSALDGQKAHSYILMSTDQAVKLSAEKEATRDEIEKKIEELRARKSKTNVDDYYQQLEVLMVQMANLYLEK